MLLTPDCHGPDMAITCPLAQLHGIPSDLQNPCRLNILKLVSLYNYLQFHIFHSPTATAPKSLGRRWRLGAPAAVGSAGPPPSAQSPGRGPGGGSEPPGHQAKQPPPKSAPSSRLGSNTIPLAVRFSPMASFRLASKVGVRPTRCQSWRLPSPGEPPSRRLILASSTPSRWPKGRRLTRLWRGNCCRNHTMASCWESGGTCTQASSTA